LLAKEAILLKRKGFQSLLASSQKIRYFIVITFSFAKVRKIE